MKQHLLSFAEAKGIPITEYLSRLGFEPARIRGHDYWYHSPFRTERTPSFKVNAKMNRWFDYGEWEGGSILDLGMKIHQCTLHEFMQKLSDGNRMSVSTPRPPVQKEKPEPELEVLSVNNLANPYLTHYIRTRGIDEKTATRYCQEIQFRIGKKTYYAIGFANRSGGYELRNGWFKGSSFPKDVTLISNGSMTLSVLEGFMDFLSLLQLDQPEIRPLIRESDFLILNSVGLLKRSTDLVRSYAEVNAFFDNDTAGNKAKEQLKAESIPFRDASLFYQAHKDVNEYLVNSIRKKNKSIRRGYISR